MRKIKEEMGASGISRNKTTKGRKKIIDLCNNFALLMRSRMLEKYDEGRRDWDRRDKLAHFKTMAVEKSINRDSIDAANYNMLVYYHTKIRG